MKIRLSEDIKKKGVLFDGYYLNLSEKYVIDIKEEL